MPQQMITQNNQQSLTQFNKLISRDKTGDYGILPTEIWDIIYHIKYSLNKMAIKY